MPTRDILNEAVQAMLVAATGKEIGLGKLPAVPTGKLYPPVPYAVLYPLHSPTGTGSFARLEEDRDFVYQVTCAGQTDKQVSWMSSKVMDAFLDPVVGPITAAGWVIQWRRSVQLGAILPSGPDLYISQDTYQVRAGSADA